MVQETTTEAKIVRVISREMARSELHAAWFGGKNADMPISNAIDLTSNDDGSGYVELLMPLDWIRPNELGERYDGTVDADRMRRYAQLEIDTPVYLSYGPKLQRLGRPHANVMDGGHRVSAARLKNLRVIPAIMRRSSFECLVHARRSILEIKP